MCEKTLCGRSRDNYWNNTIILIIIKYKSSIIIFLANSTTERNCIFLTVRKFYKLKIMHVNDMQAGYTVLFENT